MKKALISGALGQDGSHMCEYLLSLGGYEVWGGVRGMVNGHQHHGVENVHYIYLDLRDELSIESALRKVQPDELYNFGGQVFVPTSWTNPAETFDVNTGGLARILACIELLHLPTRVYQASSSEMFGNSGIEGVSEYTVFPLNEESKMCPVSPYAISKYAAHKLCDVYRKKGLFVVSGICGNHEGPRRGPEMVTRKITRAVAQWATGNMDFELSLGSLETRRDWGYAGDYVKVMHKMLQQSEPEDFVIGTGVSHSVMEFGRAAKKAAGLYEGKSYPVKINVPEQLRQNEIHVLTMDASKAKEKLGWVPETSFEALVRMMVDADIAAVQRMVTA